MGDEPADVHASPGLGVGELGDGPDPGAPQLVAQVLDGVALAPQIPWLVTITAGALLVALTMARRPTVEAAPR